MKLRINNLGPIKDADIDISKRLTVFCGPNNSGKTYVAFLVYALTKAVIKIDRSEASNLRIENLLSKKASKFKLDIAQIWKYRNSEIRSIKQSLDSLYGVNEDVVKTLFKNFDISIIQSKKEFSDSVAKMNFESTFKLDEIEILISKKSKTQYVEIEFNKQKISKRDIDITRRFLNSRINSLIAFYPFSTSHILPVERNSIYTFSKELSIQKQDFLDRAQDLASKKKKNPLEWLFRRSTRYPLPIKDGLEIAEDLSNYTKMKSDFYETAVQFEKEILGGTMSISKDGDVLFTSQKAKSKKIPIHLSASIVKTLSSLVFYLKHIANKNDLIIIDEPELNLHPNNQIVFARFLSKLVNQGFRLLVSTHSDYIIRELNNLIMLSSNKKEIKTIREELGYAIDEKLNKEQVSAYLFNYKKVNSRNVTVFELPISDTGFEIETIDRTVEALNEASERLFYSIKYNESND